MMARPVGSPAAYVSADMIDLAMRAAWRVRDEGIRGATMVSVEQIVAMATLLVLFDTAFAPEDEPIPEGAGT